MPLTRPRTSLLVDLAIRVVWRVVGTGMTNWRLRSGDDFGGKTRCGLKG